nr:tRNA 2-thiouridine(34) synthase MnmA [Lachnospiraceae bacterium]
MNQTVVVGMSGGVDSSVAAYLLKEQGYHVIGVTMEMLKKAPEVGEEANDAKKICDRLEIPHYIMHFNEEFECKVMNPFVEEYLHGRTPNPCVLCNRNIKWQALMERGKKLGADYIATGHYARIIKLPNGRYTVKNAASMAKDQTYVLCQLSQEQLSHTLMPVGAYEKEEIRSIAKKLGMEVADKKDSQDICFIDDDYSDFLEERLHGNLPPEGNFVWKDGTVVGRHKGITHYTIGQRKGLNIALGKPVFVKKIVVEKNEVVLGDNEDVFTDSLVADQWNMISEETLDETKTYIGKIRYSHKGTECKVKKISDTEYQVNF